MRNIVIGFILGVTLGASFVDADMTRTPWGTRFGDDAQKSGYPQVIVPVPGETVVPVFPRQERPC